MVATLFSAPSVAMSDERVPRQQITAGFDLAAGRLFGTSLITLPAHLGAHLELGDLTITYLRMDGEKLAAPADDHFITIHPTDHQRLLTVSFEKVVPTDANVATDNLVSRQGITLTGFWHPRLDIPGPIEPGG